VATKLCRKSAIITALQSLGFKSHMIEQFETAVPLKGYQGDSRSQRANIRIRGSGWGHSQNYVGGCSNDLGFELLSDGTYALHVSEYDSSKYNKAWVNNLEQQYALAVCHEVIEDQGLTIEEEEEVGQEIYLTISVPY
jgi:hypothetical protein